MSLACLAHVNVSLHCYFDVFAERINDDDDDDDDDDCESFIAGPSLVVDTACSSSLLALDHALHAIRSGQCDAAVVGGTSLCLNPRIAVQFMKLGMLSPYGACKSFDASGE